MIVKKRFEFLEHPSDVGIIAYGSNEKELFQNAAFGMFSLMSNLERVEARLPFDIEVEAPDTESLLVSWLNELIFIEDSKKVLFKDFKISSLTGQMLKAKALGEKIDLSRHKVSRPVKAATFNQLEIKKEDDILKAKVIFDV